MPQRTVRSKAQEMQGGSRVERTDLGRAVFLVASRMLSRLRRISAPVMKAAVSDARNSWSDLMLAVLFGDGDWRKLQKRCGDVHKDILTSTSRTLTPPAMIAVNAAIASQGCSGRWSLYFVL